MARFAAFHHRNFRRYVAGQVISSVGSWLQALAVTWLVLERTGRSDRLGVAVALQFLPLLLLGVPAGMLADRVDNRRLLLVTSAVSAVVASGFGLLVSSGTAGLGAIYALTLASGLVLAVERPAMQAFVFQLVGRDDLPSAVAANSTVVASRRTGAVDEVESLPREAAERALTAAPQVAGRGLPTVDARSARRRWCPAGRRRCRRVGTWRTRPCGGRSGWPRCGCGARADGRCASGGS